MTKSELIEFIEKSNCKDIKKVEITHYIENGQEITTKIMDCKKY